MRKKTFHNLPQEDTPVEAGELNEMQTWIDEDKLEVGMKTVADWDTATEVGFVLTNTSTINGPTGLRYGAGFVLPRANSLAQVVIDCETGVLYSRARVSASSNFSEWK